MKKTLCLLNLLLIAITGFSQIQVSEDGNVGVKTENSGLSSLEIKPEGNRINLFSHYTYNGTENWPTNGYFQSIINTDQNFRGLYSYVKNQGTGSAHGIWVNSISDASGAVVGFRNYTYGFQYPTTSGSLKAKTGFMNHVYGSGDNNNDSDENRTGIYTNVTGAGSGKRTGLDIVLNGMGTGERTGIYNRINEGGDGYKHGIDNYISGMGDGLKTGINNVVYGEGTGLRRGTVNQVFGTGRNSRRGIQNIIYGFVDGPHDNATTKYGVFSEVRGALNAPDSDEQRVGIYSRVEGQGAGSRSGVSNVVTGDGLGSRTGIYSLTTGTGDGERLGVYNFMEGSGNGDRKGIQNFVRGSGNGLRYGIRNLTYGDGNNTYYGIYNSVEGDNSTATKYGIYTRVSTNNSTNSYALYASNGINYAGYFNGDVHITGQLTGGGASDRRLKRDIQKIGPSLSILLQLQPVTYFFDHPSIKLPEGKQIGLIAQEVEPLVPEAVREVSFVIPDKQQLDPENLKGTNEQTKDYKVIDYEKLIPVLIKSVQEQQEIIEQQFEQIKLLQKRLDEIENKI